jgi:allophanate hydrolase/urea carboxylase
MIKVIKAGLQLTIQDFGRLGHRHIGVSLTGSLDPFAQIIANRLLNNNDNDAVLELTLGLAELQFLCDTHIAITGADLNAKLDQQLIYPGWSYKVNTGQTLSFGTPREGLRAYIAVKGGINCPEIMNSKSTDINNHFGGHNGEPLTSGDMIFITEYNNTFKQLGALNLPKRNHIRIHKSIHSDLLGADLLNAFINTEFTVSQNTNRMGARLNSVSDSLTHDYSLPSIGVAPGCIQLPPNGEPIVLLNDCQTTGGYPLLGCVIEADLHQFAQFKPGTNITFEYVDNEQAEKAKQKIVTHLQQLQIALNNKEKG